MKGLQMILASICGSTLVLFSAYLGNIPILPADFLPALLPLLMDPGSSWQKSTLFWAGPVLLTAELFLLLFLPGAGVWIPGVNALFLCSLVPAHLALSYSHFWRETLHSRRGKICRLASESMTRLCLLASSAAVAAGPLLLGLDRFVVDRGFLAWAAVSGLALTLLFGWILASRIRKQRIMFFRETIRQELRALQEKETDARRVNVHSDPARDLYNRAIEMMRSKKPFLLYEFTLYDMAQRLITNKMYLSRTINAFSGRGFRSFVNFFRIQYSINLFRKTPTMKVHTLAELSGFHNQVTYTAAFKLEMGMTPGEYFTLLMQGEDVPPCPEYPSTFPVRPLPARTPFSGRGGSK